MSRPSPAISFFVFSILLLIVGFFAYIYERTVWGYSVGYHPYRDMGLLLIAFGFLLGIAGAVLLAVKKPQIERRAEDDYVLVVLKRCPKCGKQYSGREYQFCPTCGIKLEPA